MTVPLRDFGLGVIGFLGGAFRTTLRGGGVFFEAATFLGGVFAESLAEASSAGASSAMRLSHALSAWRVPRTA